MSDSRLLSAVIFGQQKHAGQIRKYGGNEPYFNHCLRVAKTVSDAGFVQDAVIAALLHDTLEDTDCSQDEILNLFGAQVLHYVVQLTDTPVTLGINRAQRKVIDAQRIKKAGLIVQAIKCADIMDNLPSIAAHDPDFARVCLPETYQLLAGMKSVGKLYDAAYNAYLAAERQVQGAVVNG